MGTGDDGTLSRRRLLQAGAVAGGALLLEGVTPAAAAPPAFPAGVVVRRRPFENWAGTVRARGLWTATPRTAREALAVVRWAHAAGWRVRPRGSMHGWSPLTITPGTGREDRVVLLDTRRLDAIAVSPRTRTVRVGAGVRLDALLEALHRHGLGMASVPATGEPTVGGALAIGAHGAALRADGERPARGTSYASLGDLVLELEAIVWDAARGRYVRRRFGRGDAELPALITHLGRALVTEVVLRTSRSVPLRCVSRTDITAAELFAAPGATTERSFDAFLQRSGRVEAIWFPFTDRPWLKIWTPAPTRPAASRPTLGPYNYPFSDRLPEPVAELAGGLVSGHEASAPAFGALQLAAVDAGLAATGSGDLWGPAKDTQRYIRASTLRVDELGIAVLCRRQDVQRVLHLVATRHESALADLQGQGRFPVNAPLEVRASALDAAGGPALAASAPIAGAPYDAVIWVNVLTLPGTPGYFAYCRGFEQWALATFDGTWAACRPEWSKGWAFTDDAPCADREMLDATIPALIGPAWADATTTLRALDPDRVLGNAFLDRFLG